MTTRIDNAIGQLFTKDEVDHFIGLIQGGDSEWTYHAELVGGNIFPLYRIKVLDERHEFVAYWNAA